MSTKHASEASKYEHMTIDKNGERVNFVNLDKKITINNFSYYESLFHPNVTANIIYTDLGNAVSANKSEDVSERAGTLTSSLPIRGNEKFEFIINSKLGKLDFRSYPLYVIAATTPTQESLRQATMLSLSSRAAIENETATLYKKYYNNIGETVNQILTKELNVPSNKLTVEKTKNSYAFTGSSRSPFSLINSLCSKSIPVQGSAGFLFWENRVGFNFRSIDSLISAPPVATYQYYGVATTSYDNDDNDFRIYSYSSQKDHNMLNALQTGSYKTKNVFFNPYNFEYSEIYLSLSKAGLINLGSEPEYPGEFDAKDAFTRTHHFILDPGNMEIGISNKINNDPREYQAKAVMRYNLLMTQVLTMMIPCNPKLKAGDNIICEFEKTTFGNKAEGSVEESKSGKYLIMHLCHSFDTKRSFTSLTLVRDTYGLYTGGG
jgi:hypothetical protein